MSIHRKENVHRFSKKHYNSSGFRTGYSRPALFGGEIHYDRKGRRIGVSGTESKSTGSYDSYSDDTSEEEYDPFGEEFEDDLCAASSDFTDESDDITDFLDAMVAEMDGDTDDFGDDFMDEYI